MIFWAMEETGMMDVCRVTYVADRALDLSAGTNAGVRYVVGVLWGSEGVEQPGSVANTRSFGSATELSRLISAA